MKRSRSLDPLRGKLLLVVLVLGILLGVFLAASSQGHRVSASRKQTKNRPPSEPEERAPLADFREAEPLDPTEREVRRARNNRYDNRYTVPLDQLPPDTAGQSRISYFWVNMPALPTGQSDAVVIGRVVRAKGYLSNDRTGAYSEFTVLIEDVLKDDIIKSVRRGDSITTEREGADVLLPADRTIRVSLAGEGTPQMASRYVLFLRRNEDIGTYHILTGYELDNGTVSPLDKRVERFSTYKNTDEQKFLAAVKHAVVSPPEAPQDMRRPNQEHSQYSMLSFRQCCMS